MTEKKNKVHWYEAKAEILQLIRENGSISQYKLIKTWGSPATVYKYLKMLHAEGLIRLQREPSTRGLTGYKNIWVITPKGMVERCPLCGHPIEATSSEGGWI